MPSHGISGTVIFVGGGKSTILSCAHGFRGQDRTKHITIDAPAPNPGQAARPGTRLLKVDYESDLSLIEVAAELPYSTPVAPIGHHPGRLLSAGYDEMKWPATQRTATFLGSAGNLTYTRERPWHGRSGGGLLDVDNGYLIGVVQGYEVNGRGMYASHAAICRFLNWPGTQQAAPSPGRPWVSEGIAPYGSQPPLIIGAPPCPGGVCQPGH